MTTTPRRPFSPRVQTVIDEFVPMLRQWHGEVGKYAIAIGGSQGKDSWDERSDVDFRFFYERPLPSEAARPDLWNELNGALERWQAKGVTIDGVWPRQISEIDAALERWLKGELCPPDYVWTIWGYHLLPDIHHQVILEDPYQVIANWKARLQPYPPQLKKAILDKHWASLQ